MKAAGARARGRDPALGSVSVVVSSSLNAFRTHKRYSTGLTIAEFKCKLELVVGSLASCMDLELYGAEEELLGCLDCDEALLGSYPVADGCHVHVIDQGGAHIGEYEDVSQVEKYKIAESDYKKQPESLRSFLRQQRWGHYDAEGTRCWVDKLQQCWAQEAVLVAALPLGARCQVWLLGQPSKLATIMFVGQTDFKPGYWVGVRYDEPLGKHDGSMGGCRYFKCQPKPQSVTPGDFPEEDDSLEEEL